MVFASIVQAVKDGDKKFVRKFLEEQRKEVNTSDAEDCTLLHWASLENQIDIAKLLLNSGANVNAFGGEENETPLILALYNKHYQMAEMLYQHGSDLLLKSPSTGLDCIHQIIRHHRDKDGNDIDIDINSIFLLLYWGANSNNLDKHGNTPVMWLLDKMMGKDKEIRTFYSNPGYRSKLIKASNIFDIAEIFTSLSKENQLDFYEVNQRFYEIGSQQGIEDFSNFALRELI